MGSSSQTIFKPLVFDNIDNIASDVNYKNYIFITLSSKNDKYIVFLINFLYN